MNLRRRFLTAVCLVPALLAFNAWSAGLQWLDIPAEGPAPALRGAVWYPCAQAGTAVRLGPSLTLEAARDCPVSAKALPLVIVSHGSGGSFAGHHDTAQYLADHGFVVAAISHPGDHFQDRGRQGELSIFGTRAMDMRRLLDFMLQRWSGHDALDAKRVGLFGFSRGGTTGLILSDASADLRMARRLCQQFPDAPLCDPAQALDTAPAMPAADARIRAAVIADPFPLFSHQALQQVAIPIQLWASTQGGDGVDPQDAAQIREGLPAQLVEFHEVPAGHFAFLAPCQGNAPRAPLCMDPPGFDRTQFHQRLNAQVLAFFRRHLTSQ